MVRQSGRWAEAMRGAAGTVPLTLLGKREQPSSSPRPCRWLQWTHSRCGLGRGREGEGIILWYLV